MKLSLLIASATLAALIACATTDDEAPPTAPPAEAGLPPADAAIEDAAIVDGAPEAEAGLPACSADGFCPADVPPDQTLRAVWGDNAGAIWAVSAQGGILLWDGTASAWKVHVTVAGALYAIWGSGPTDVWIAGEKGLFHGTGASAATLTFSATTAPGDATIALTSVWGTGPTDVWAVGGLPPDRDVFPYGPAKARVLHLTTAGAPWTLDAATTNSGVGLARVWGSAKSGVWLAGPRAIVDNDFADEIVVLRKAPGAAAFTAITLPGDPTESAPYDRLSKLTGGTTSGDTTMWILGRNASDEPGYWHGTSPDNGVTFTFAFSKGGTNDEPYLNAVVGIGANDAWAVGDYGRVRHWTGAPGTWPQAAVTRTSFPVITPFYGAWASSAGDLWVVGGGLSLQRKAGAP